MPELDKDHIDRSKSLLKSGHATEVVRLLAPRVAENEDDLAAWSVLGAAYFELEQWEAAEDAARQSLRLDPDSARNWSNLGTILRKQGRYQEAEEAQERALSLDRKYRRAETELVKIEDEREAASQDAGWKVRTPDGDFLGPLSRTELREQVTLGQVEPGWNARRGTGRITSVREAIGDEACDEAVRARAAAMPAEPKPEAQEDTAGDSTSKVGRGSSKALVGALIAVIFVLGASLIWVFVSRDEPAGMAERPSPEVAAKPSTEPEDSHHSRSADSDAQAASRDRPPPQTQAPAEQSPERAHQVPQPEQQPALQEPRAQPQQPSQEPRAQPQQQPPSTSAPPPAVAPQHEVTTSNAAVRREALDVIRDLQTVVEVGVNHQDYGNYVIEAKRELRRLQRRVPSGALWWAEISRAMSDYEFARDAWDWKFDGDGVRNFVWEDTPEFRIAIMKYGKEELKPWFSRRERIPGMPGTKDFPGLPPTPARWRLWIDGIVQTAWGSASKHIQRASATNR